MFISFPKTIVVVVMAVAAGMAGTGAVKAQTTLQPINLRSGLRANPLGVGDAAPRLSWQLPSAGLGRGELQSAYQVQVDSTAGAADLWDSGKVSSAATVDILYAGQPLTSGKQCFWHEKLMRMHYSLPQSKMLRVFGGVGRRGSGLEDENP